MVDDRLRLYFLSMRLMCSAFANNIKIKNGENIMVPSCVASTDPLRSKHYIMFYLEKSGFVRLAQRHSRVMIVKIENLRVQHIIDIL